MPFTSFLARSRPLVAVGLLMALSAPAPAPAQSIEQRVQARFNDVLRPCLTWIETGTLTRLPDSYEQKGRKATFLRPGERSWSARIEFDTRRKKRECGLTVRGAILSRPEFDAMAQKVMGQVTSTGQATFLRNQVERGKTYSLYRIGGDTYRVSVLSGGTNSWTQVFVSHANR